MSKFLAAITGFAKLTKLTLGLTLAGTRCREIDQLLLRRHTRRSSQQDLGTLYSYNYVREFFCRNWVVDVPIFGREKFTALPICQWCSVSDGHDCYWGVDLGGSRNHVLGGGQNPFWDGALLVEHIWALPSLSAVKILNILNVIRKRAAVMPLVL